MELRDARAVHAPGHGYAGASASAEPPKPLDAVLRLAAESEHELRACAASLAARIESEGSAWLHARSWAATGLASARAARRLAVPIDSAARLGTVLRQYASAGAAAGVRSGARPSPPPPLAMLFTGQGAQYAGMARGLYDRCRSFRRRLDHCEQVLGPELDRPLRALLDARSERSLLDETRYTQPALFALESALFDTWRSWGCAPAAVLGHSVGEYAAAYAAGAFDLEHGLRLIAARGRLMDALPRAGEMAAVRASVERVRPILEESDEATVAIAAVNAPDNTVISGAREAVQAVRRRLEQEGIGTQTLATSHAFHSPLVEGALAELQRCAAAVEFRPLQLPLASNLTGTLLPPGTVLDADYWVEHARRPVLFAAGLEALWLAGCRTFVEIGPGATLIGLARRVLDGGEELLLLPSLKRGQEDERVLRAALAALYVRGPELDWRAIAREEDRT